MRNVTQASLSREGDRVSGGRSFSWHRVIKFYTARILLQSRPAPAPSRREPFIESNLSPTEALKICCRNNALQLPSPVGEGAELAEADEVSAVVGSAEQKLLPSTASRAFCSLGLPPPSRGRLGDIAYKKCYIMLPNTPTA